MPHTKHLHLAHLLEAQRLVYLVFGDASLQPALATAEYLPRERRTSGADTNLAPVGIETRTTKQSRHKRR
ncbi:hypothetical protein N7510_011829 [Penicillium lagena]|uniref:uncharacterized protein n=1 Tax=Penicillium lagena TaxID=94218 RepID=UPI0025401A7D|nr:uncharacterized protein N7510_011829 [Penicillium lagena]KAJ5598879.1 hypothetical protein N7510_011829 [Penicillium lagena]